MNNTLRDPDKITMTHTGLLPGKKGKLIHVLKERRNVEETLPNSFYQAVMY